MSENGPRTHELVAEVKDLSDRLRERGNEIERRLTRIEADMRTIRWIGGFFGTVISGVMVLLIIGVLR